MNNARKTHSVARYAHYVLIATVAAGTSVAATSRVLRGQAQPPIPLPPPVTRPPGPATAPATRPPVALPPRSATAPAAAPPQQAQLPRSEERRGGTGGSPRGGPRRS